MTNVAVRPKHGADGSARRWLMCAAVCLGILAAFPAYFLSSADIADPVRIRAWGLSLKARTHDREAVHFLAATAPQPGVAIVSLTAANHLYATEYWYFEHLWIHRMMLKLPKTELAGIEKVTVTVGADTFEAGGEEIRSWPSVQPPSASQDVLLEIPLPKRVSALAGLGNRPLNWPGDAVFVRTIAQYALAPIVLVVFVGLVWGSRPPVGQGADAPRSPSGLWNWAGLLFLIGSLVFLEVRDPYYFTQCDSLTECLPMILTGMRAFWQGDFPDYNPYLFGGSPLAGLGVYGLTYPPLHFSYAIARHLLGDEFAAIEVFAFLHLVAGFLLTRMLGRKLGLSALSANLLALAVVLSGASLIMGRSWFNFIPLTVWLPLAFLGLVQLRQGPVSWKWVAGMGLVLGLPVHAGFAQPVMYTAGFFCLAALWLWGCGDIPGRRMTAVPAALLLAAAVALPLVYQQWLTVRGVERPAADAAGVGTGLAAMLLPYPLAVAHLPSNWGNVNLHLLGHFYFFGGLFAWLFLLHLARLAVKRPAQGEWAGQVWTVCAIAAIWLGLGESFGLWTLIGNLPFVGFINRHPLRLMPFIVFFTSIVGAFALDRLLQQASNLRRTAAGAMALSLFALHVVNCRTAFHIDRFTPYPPIPDLVAMQLCTADTPPHATGRVLRWGPYSDNEAFGKIMPASLPAGYRVPSIEGTSALLEDSDAVARLHARVSAQPLPAMRVYGIRWHLIQAPDRFTPPGTVFSASWRFEVITMRDKLGEKLDLTAPFTRITPAEGVGGIELYELPETDPLAFPCDEPARQAKKPSLTLPARKSPPGERTALPLTYRGGGMDVNVSGLARGQWVTVNFLRRPEGEMEAFLDGVPVPHQGDVWERIVVRLPSVGNTLAIRCTRPWATGFMFALAPALAGIGLMLVGGGRAFRIQVSSQVKSC